MKKQTFGMLVASLRKQKGMTQLDLAAKMGVTDKAVSKWERDLSYPDVGSLPRLAEVLRTSGFPDEAALCRSALEGKPADCAETDAATARYWGFVRDAGGDIAQSIAQSVHSRAWFASHRPERGRGGLAAHCLRVCWLTLAPAVLECAEAAREARADFASYAHGLPGGDAVSDAVLNVLDHMRGE